MNILQAYELAKAGKTVISPNGRKVTAVDFKNFDDWAKEDVFGEWLVKQEPVVFETEVEYANNTAFGPGKGLIWSADLKELIGERVKVTVEVIDDQA